MTESLFSSSWYRVENLKPRLRSHARFRRHEYRGELWYVLEDQASGRHHRFSPAAYMFAARLNGRRTVQQAWDTITDKLGDDAPTQDDTIQLLGRLHGADVLQCDVPPDTVELFKRHQKEEKQKWKKRFANPLALRMPLCDPDRFLERWLPLVQPFLGWFGFVIWAIIVGVAILFAVSNIGELSEHAYTQGLSATNLLLLVCVYPFVKLLHEFGHAFATRSRGGEVHEMGLVLLVLMPVPYVDASASSSFPEKRERIFVSAAGMIVELFLSAIALFVWLQVEPGIVRDIALNVMLIGGISTVAFNGNPLLKFDGYYIFADLIDVPNLGSRSNQFFTYLVQKHILAARVGDSPVTAQGEAKWLVFYSVTSYLYRLTITFAILMLIAMKVFLLGVTLGIWMVFVQIVKPLWKILVYLFTSPAIERTRIRAFALCVVFVSLVGGMLVLYPAPHVTRAEGVLWLPDRAHVRAGSEGFVVQLLVREDTAVKEGDPLIELRDPFVSSELKVLAAELKELRIQYDAMILEDRVQAQIIKEEIATAGARYNRKKEKIDDLVVRSPANGRFVVPGAVDLPGRFVRQGEPIGYVVDFDDVRARVVVRQADVALVRNSTEAVQLRFVNDVDAIIESSIRREVPAATDRLPSAALGTQGGGNLTVDPQDADGIRTLDTVFQFDLNLPDNVKLTSVGNRVYARFSHGTEALAFQWYRSLRQLLLRQFTL